VWNVSYVGDEALSRCISVLRRVFRDDPRNPHVIETISKTGYRLMRADPQRQERSEEGDGVVHGRPSRGVRSVDLPSLFIGGWFRTSVTRYGAGPLSDVEWLELVSRAQALLGVAGDSRGSATSTRGRAWTFHSWWKVLVLTTIPITEGGAEQHLLRLQVRDAAVLGELVPAVVGLVSTALVGVGMGALGFAAPLAFGLALALAVTCGLSLLAIRRIRRRLVRRRQELYRLLEALAP
jgi:hypothetical protein